MLNNDQQEAFDKIIEFINTDGAQFFSLNGSAGTGKTYLMGEVSRALGKVSQVTAPTNKAVKVLSEKTGGAGLTIHKFLGLTVQKSKGATKVVRKDSDAYLTEAKGIKVVILDEGSMVDDSLAKFVYEDAVYESRKYIIGGDLSRLPPVQSDSVKGMQLSKVFEMSEPEDRYTLTKIVRQEEGNPIITLASSIREAIELGTEPNIFAGKDEEGHGVYVMRPEVWMEALRRSVEVDEFSMNVDFCRVICWTNAAALSYNSKVREFLGKDPSVPFQAGEAVVFNEAYNSTSGPRNTGHEDFAVSVTPYQFKEYGMDFKCWEVMLASDEDEYLVLDHASIPAYKNGLRRIADDCKQENSWSQYWAFKEMFADIRSPYGLTVHKSQGSTFTNVFVDFGDIYSNRRKVEADMCLYTAITRASSRVFIKY